jgi:hypothetical protein
VYVFFALIAAAAFAGSSVLKHRSAQDLDPAVDTGHAKPGSGLRRIVAGTIRHPLWLLAIGVDTLGLVMQVLALHLGPLATVQPILVSSLVFALLFNGRRGWHELAWPLVLLGSLAMLISLTATGGSSGASTAPDTLPLVLTAAVVLLATAGGLILVEHPYRRLRSAPVLGVGVGVIYATTAALLKAASDQFTQNGVTGLLTSWQLYAFIVLGAAGLVLSQAAFRAGPLRESLPATSVIDPLASIVIGVAVYDEHLRHGPVTGPLSVLALAVLIVATVFVSRDEAETATSPTTADHQSVPFEESCENRPRHRLLPARGRRDRDAGQRPRPTPVGAGAPGNRDHVDPVGEPGRP